MNKETQPRIIQWLLDTRKLWPVSPSPTPKDEVQKLKTIASEELSFLTDAEQASVLKYYHLSDAKMSLASHLLKHTIITKYCSVPWSQSTISRDSKGKPCFISTGPSLPRVDFNVSHQAGIVTLIAAVGFEEKVDVGTDVVCWNERQKYDYAHIEKDGLFDWIDMHAEVFADTEVSHMKLGALDLGIDVKGYGKDAIARCEQRGGSIEVMVDGSNLKIERNRIVDGKLRRFSAMWCLREAFVKMTGDALLATWLKELEIVDVQAPKGVGGDDGLEEGETLTDLRIFFKERRVNDVKIEITALGANYMVAGSVRGPEGMLNDSSLTLGRWKQLGVEDILKTARAGREMK